MAYSRAKLKSKDDSIMSVGPCHHDMARPQVANRGDGLQIWRVTMKRPILNKQSRTADKELSSSLRFSRSINNSSP